ncbi:unnamed protein product [Medioppia subpectinata]|uniref:Uncharacterized protein n=1 Tax=Medioppia subpectinata TaxID=1979941 RepID=A0A7R9KMG6_9ACAR|nr:unnamed protein product [Medioppia subpectinata]CAG2106323.1 unnamed protein product [Medioppia subpectinata]
MIKQFNAENGIKIMAAETETSADQSIAPVANSSLTKAMGSKKSRFSFTKIMTNAGYYVKQSLGLSTRTGTGVNDGVGDDRVKGAVVQPELPMPTLSAESTPIASPLEPGSHPSAPINYLNVDLNVDTFNTTATFPHMPYITVTVCVVDVWVTCVRFTRVDYLAVMWLMQILSTGADDPDVIVKQMAKSGFDGWDYTKCLNYFYNALEFYKQTLANCPNRETAATVYPLFDTMHSFVPYFLMTTKKYTKLNELKRLFAEKCGEYVDTTTGINDDTPCPTPHSTEIIHDIVSQSCAAPNDLLYQQIPKYLFVGDELLNTDMSVNDLPVPDTVEPTVAAHQPPADNSEQNPIDYLGLPVTGKKFTVNSWSPHLPYMTSIIKVKGVWFKTGHICAANHLALNLLLQLVNKHRPTGGSPMTETEWAQVLEVCRNMDRAGIVFPMFYTLHIFS